MTKNNTKNKINLIRKMKIRAKLKKVSDRPRLSVFRSNKHINTQIIDDRQGKTMLMVSDKNIKNTKKLTKTEAARLVGRLLAQKAKKLKISKVYFDRGHYKYLGRIKTLADAARKGGLVF